MSGRENPWRKQMRKFSKHPNDTLVASNRDKKLLDPTLRKNSIFESASLFGEVNPKLAEKKLTKSKAKDVESIVVNMTPADVRPKDKVGSKPKDNNGKWGVSKLTSDDFSKLVERKEAVKKASDKLKVGLTENIQIAAKDDTNVIAAIKQEASEIQEDKNRKSKNKRKDLSTEEDCKHGKSVKSEKSKSVTSKTSKSDIQDVPSNTHNEDEPKLKIGKSKSIQFDLPDKPKKISKALSVQLSSSIERPSLNLSKSQSIQLEGTNSKGVKMTKARSIQLSEKDYGSTKKDKSNKKEKVNKEEKQHKDKSSKEKSSKSEKSKKEEKSKKSIKGSKDDKSVKEESFVEENDSIIEDKHDSGIIITARSHSVDQLSQEIHQYEADLRNIDQDDGHASSKSSDGGSSPGETRHLDNIEPPACSKSVEFPENKTNEDIPEHKKVQGAVTARRNVSPNILQRTKTLVLRVDDDNRLVTHRDPKVRLQLSDEEYNENLKEKPLLSTTNEPGELDCAPSEKPAVVVPPSVLQAQLAKKLFVRRQTVCMTEVCYEANLTDGEGADDRGPSDSL